jgi:histidine ammonia-lyase
MASTRPDRAGPLALTLADVAAVAASNSSDSPLASLPAGFLDRLPTRHDHAAMAPVRRAHLDLAAARSAGTVYGLTTGVGALRHVVVDQPAPDSSEGGHAGHALRLWRSHAAGVGPELDDGLARATMLVRLNQLLHGGSGVHPDLVVALASALARGAVPTLHSYGPVGTGDLGVLAELGLTLIGELPWRSGTAPSTTVREGDALPFISSNAMTAALGAIAVVEVRRLARAAEQVAALSHLALRGSRQAYDRRVFAAKADPSAAAVAERLLGLLGIADREAARVQDPFGLRTVPQVHGPLEDALDAAEQALTAEIGAAAENPLIVDGTALHHGQFLTQRIAASLDAVRATALPALTLSAARLGALMNSELMGLPAFLASGPAGSSGLMIVEYVAADLLVRAGTAASPVTSARTTLALSLEEHASHATQAAWQSRDLADLGRQLLACELVAAVRALRMAPERAAGATVAAFLERADAALPHELADHILGPELRAAAELVAQLGD